jgi:serine/threonine protein kinase
LASLHEAGIIWGDAKAPNILIDAHNNPWIVDFGGSYTPGWVEKDLAGTIEGDMQGLSRIVDYILERGCLGAGLCACLRFRTNLYGHIRRDRIM